MDEFPEAFKRFEKRVDVSRIRSFDHLALSFSHWAGKQWRGTSKQIEALKVEARRIGIPVPEERRPRRRREEGLTWLIEEGKTWRSEIDRLGRTHYRDLKTGRFIPRPENKPQRRDS